MGFNQLRMEIKHDKTNKKLEQQIHPTYRSVKNDTHSELNSKICTGPGDSRQEVCALSSPPQFGLFGPP